MSEFHWVDLKAASRADLMAVSKVVLLAGVWAAQTAVMTADDWADLMGCWSVEKRAVLKVENLDQTRAAQWAGMRAVWTVVLWAV